MIVRFKWSALKQSRWYEHVIRFGLGGLTTVLTGAVAQRYGPTTGGLFLAFPAIFCASATLIEKHERERKEAKGLQGARRGRQAAALDAAGAAWASIALGVFGLCVWWLAPASSVGSLCGAAIGWLMVAPLAWTLRRRLRWIG
jgi:hypothetical protein